MKKIIIAWEIISKSPLKVTYYINSSLQGNDEMGIKKIISFIKENPKIETVVFKGKATQKKDTGASMYQTLPFYFHWKELLEVIGNKTIITSIK